MRNKNLASFAVVALVVLLLTIPLLAVLGLVSNEAYSTYKTLNQHDLGTNFIKVVCTQEDWLSCRATKSLLEFMPDSGNAQLSAGAKLDRYLQLTIARISVFIIDNVSKFLVSVPSLLLNFFVMIFVIYYLLKDGDKVSARIKNLLPLKESHKQKVIGRFHDITFGSFYGNLAVAVLQGFLGGLGFFVLGVSSPILWGFVMALFALLPYVGTAFIWLPAGLNLIFLGYIQNDTSPTIKGIVLIIYGILVVSTVDNIIKPKLISAKADVHPILVLLGVLGGLSIFGFIGLILGPVLLALLITFTDIYDTEKAEMEKYF